jgi:glycosyltransferase involved in cell wall biosynthesis
MRILHIDTGREMRGGQWQVLRLIEGLRAEGVETLLVARAGSPLAGIVGEAVSPAQIRRLDRSFDLIHAHDARAHAWAVALARAPVIVARRVAFPIGAGWLSRWKYRRAAHFIAVSEYVRGLMIERGIPEEKISVVYDGVPLLEPAAGGTKILAPPPTRDKPAEFYQRAGIEISFAKDLQADLKTAAIFVYLSMSEGLGSGVLLAMSAGVPVIASKTGGIPEIIRHEENGLLVDERPESLKSAIAALRSDPALARRLGEAGRRTVAEKFSTGRMVRDTLAVYRRILAC